MEGRGFWRSLSQERETHSSRVSITSSSSFRYSSSENLFKHYRSLFESPQTVVPVPSKSLYSGLFGYDKSRSSDIDIRRISSDSFHDSHICETRSEIFPIRKSRPNRYEETKNPSNERETSVKSSIFQSKEERKSFRTREVFQDNPTIRKSPRPSSPNPSAIFACRAASAPLPSGQHSSVQKWLEGDGHFRTIRSSFLETSCPVQSSERVLLETKSSRKIEHRDEPINKFTNEKQDKLSSHVNCKVDVLNKTTENSSIEYASKLNDDINDMMFPNISSQTESFSSFVVESENKFNEFFKQHSEGKNSIKRNCSQPNEIRNVKIEMPNESIARVLQPLQTPTADSPLSSPHRVSSNYTQKLSIDNTSFRSTNIAKNDSRETHVSISSRPVFSTKLIIKNKSEVKSSRNDSKVESVTSKLNEFRSTSRKISKESKTVPRSSSRSVTRISPRRSSKQIFVQSPNITNFRVKYKSHAQHIASNLSHASNNVVCSCNALNDAKLSKNRPIRRSIGKSNHVQQILKNSLNKNALFGTRDTKSVNCKKCSNISSTSVYRVPSVLHPNEEVCMSIFGQSLL